MGITKNLIKFGKISGKGGILKVEEKQIALIGIRKKNPDMNPRQRELGAIWLKGAKTRIEKLTKTLKEL